jgi:2-C-methyl-D-erythritol 4-phosphate cytidylyltransferase
MDVFALTVEAESFQRMGEKTLLSLEDTNATKRVLSIFSHDKIKGIVLVYQEEEVAKIARDHPHVCAVVEGEDFFVASPFVIP